MMLLSIRASYPAVSDPLFFSPAAAVNQSHLLPHLCSFAHTLEIKSFSLMQCLCLNLKILECTDSMLKQEETKAVRGGGSGHRHTAGWEQGWTRLPSMPLHCFTLNLLERHCSDCITSPLKTPHQIFSPLTTKDITSKFSSARNFPHFFLSFFGEAALHGMQDLSSVTRD